MDLTPKQQEALRCLLTNENCKYLLYGGAAGSGKALALNETVCTPYGFRKVGDLEEGDIVTDPTTGGLQHIIQLHPIETREYFRVTFSDGTRADCSGEHLWELHQSRKKGKRKDADGNVDKQRVWDTRMVAAWLDKKASGMYKGCNLLIPLTKAVTFTCTRNTMRPIDPYVLGVMIGNGCMTECYTSRNRVCLSEMDDYVVERVRQAGYVPTYIKQKKDSKAIDYIYKDGGLVSALDYLGLSGHGAESKFIPRGYKYGSIDVRKQIMQGLMDTDGCVGKHGHLSYTTVSERLAEDVAFIVRSLGGYAKVSRNKSGYRRNGEYHECRDSYDVYISTTFDDELVSLPRKRERIVPDHNPYERTYKAIVSVESIGLQTGRCITVDNPRGLFCTNSFTVTHNSYLGCEWLLFMCYTFPNTRWFVGREDIKSTRQSVWVTFCKVAKEHGFDGFKQTDEGIHFDNGSVILFIGLTYMPYKDPMFERLGSKEYTGGWIEEAGEIHYLAFEVLKSRTGRHLNNEYGIPPKILLTCNPKKGWLYDTFYKPWREGKLEDVYAFIQSLPKDNPYLPKDYIENLNNIKDKTTRERLLNGLWEYDDDPSALCDYDAICDLFVNEHVKPMGYPHISADIAGKGHDRYIAFSWVGNVATLDVDMEYSPAKVVEQSLRELMVKRKVGRSLTIVDADGVGSFVESYLNGIKEFHGGARPHDPRYANLRSECYFRLAELINERKIRIVCSEAQKDAIKTELAVLKQANIDSDTSKKAVISKEDMKEQLGHSPDYMDALMMAMYYRVRATVGQSLTGHVTNYGI